MNDALLLIPFTLIICCGFGLMLYLGTGAPHKGKTRFTMTRTEIREYRKYITKQSERLDLVWLLICAVCIIMFCLIAYY